MITLLEKQMKLNFTPVCHEAKLGRHLIRVTNSHWYEDKSKFKVERAISQHSFNVGRNSTLVDSLMKAADGTFFWSNHHSPDSIYAWFDTFDEAVSAIPTPMAQDDPVGERRNYALSLRQQGLKYKEIAEKLGVGAARARQLVLLAEKDAG
jgi:hypothetical protein